MFDQCGILPFAPGKTRSSHLVVSADRGYGHLFQDVPREQKQRNNTIRVGGTGAPAVSGDDRHSSDRNSAASAQASSGAPILEMVASDSQISSSAGAGHRNSRRQILGASAQHDIRRKRTRSKRKRQRSRRTGMANATSPAPSAAQTSARPHAPVPAQPEEVHSGIVNMDTSEVADASAVTNVNREEGPGRTSLASTVSLALSTATASSESAVDIRASLKHTAAQGHRCRRRAGKRQRRLRKKWGIRSKSAGEVSKEPGALQHATRNDAVDIRMESMSLSQSCSNKAPHPGRLVRAYIQERRTKQRRIVQRLFGSKRTSFSCGVSREGTSSDFRQELDKCACSLARFLTVDLASASVRKNLIQPSKETTGCSATLFRQQDWQQLLRLAELQHLQQSALNKDPHAVVERCALSNRKAAPRIRWKPKGTTSVGLRPIIDLRHQKRDFQLRDSTAVLKAAARKNDQLGTSVFNRFQLYGKLLQTRRKLLQQMRKKRKQGAETASPRHHQQLYGSIVVADLPKCYENLSHSELKEVLNETKLPEKSTVAYPTVFAVGRGCGGANLRVATEGVRRTFVTTDVEEDTAEPECAVVLDKKLLQVRNLIVPQKSGARTIFAGTVRSKIARNAIREQSVRLPFSDLIVRSNVGIPQGAHASPLLCALSLAAKDRKLEKKESQREQGIRENASDEEASNLCLLKDHRSPFAVKQESQKKQNKASALVRTRLVDDFLYVGDAEPTCVVDEWEAVFGELHKKKSVTCFYATKLSSKMNGITSSGSPASSSSCAPPTTTTASSSGRDNIFPAAPSSGVVWAGLRFAPQSSPCDVVGHKSGADSCTTSASSSWSKNGASNSSSSSSTSASTFAASNSSRRSALPMSAFEKLNISAELRQTPLVLRSRSTNAVARTFIMLLDSQLLSGIVLDRRLNSAASVENYLQNLVLVMARRVKDIKRRLAGVGVVTTTARGSRSASARKNKSRYTSRRSVVLQHGVGACYNRAHGQPIGRVWQKLMARISKRCRESGNAAVWERVQNKLVGLQVDF
ncbi:unnamed protein product [Amoebophrya sp. A25]|nr:unnamed protein product [Amoebophrya sp. A25]|eukprot:GSA25T00012849001.1